MQELREIIDIMYNTSVEIFEAKKKALEEGDEAVERQVAKGKDIMSILCGSIEFLPFYWLTIQSTLRSVRDNMQAEKEDRLSEEELIAQMT